MHTVQSAIVFYRLCPSVCPMPVLCPNECTYRHNFWHSGRGIIFFSHIAWQNSNRNPLSGDLKYTEVGKLRFSTKIAIYIENGTRYVHGYYGSLIGSHRWPIDPCQLRWPGLILKGETRQVKFFQLIAVITLIPFDLERLWNYLYCVEWDVKLYYTIPYRTIPRTTKFGTVTHVGRGVF